MPGGRVQPNRLPGHDRRDYLDILWTSIAGLKTREEVKHFFKDLLSETEAIMLGRRLMIAKLLLEGKRYEEIQTALGVGVATISSVQQWLTSGFGGYEPALARFEKYWERRAKKHTDRLEAMNQFSFAGLKKRYPMHFLLFTLFDEVAARRNARRRYKASKRKSKMYR